MLFPFMLRPESLYDVGFRHGEKTPRKLRQSFKRRLLDLTTWRISFSLGLGGCHVVAVVVGALVRC